MAFRHVLRRPFLHRSGSSGKSSPSPYRRSTRGAVTRAADRARGPRNLSPVRPLLLASVAAISLLVGSIGVMNIMLVSVTERTREIGIRMATGARTRDILQHFLMGRSLCLRWGASSGLWLGLARWPSLEVWGRPCPTPCTRRNRLYMCCGDGLVFGFAPAMKAARLDPVVALASE